MNSAGMFSKRVVSGASVWSGASVDSERTLALITVELMKQFNVKKLFP